MYDGLEALYRRHVGEVYLYAYSLCKNPDQAQDLVGETFYRALLSLEREGEWKGWLFRVCRNLWVDSMRRRKFQTGEPPDPERLAAEEDLLEDLIREERRRAVYRAVLELSPADREAVTLHYYAGLPLREVGAAMGLSPGAGPHAAVPGPAKAQNQTGGTIVSFRELLERYRTGAATEAERALVEAELEKSAAISDYLAEGLEAELTGEGAHRTSEETEPARRVRRIVNRRLGRVAVLSAGRCAGRPAGGASRSLPPSGVLLLPAQRQKRRAGWRRAGRYLV